MHGDRRPSKALEVALEVEQRRRKLGVEAIYARRRSKPFFLLDSHVSRVPLEVVEALVISFWSWIVHTPFFTPCSPSNLICVRAWLSSSDTLRAELSVHFASPVLGDQGV